ncbi:NaeI family type II restriction endonuclease [Microbacterium sp. ARD31]|uniref:NaeI family type II restriction endonuclease n=1 Tax=Microbacterium sp. ARD31 TaxID=2962576 RepID=UPI002881ADA5|nr:NaeI family type II restriction endonuclease [Microbacterium sp. ARD31]MDT0180215.1 NaeI family type II restriction endonuclease [Microbacterium sp. ARD31]
MSSDDIPTTTAASGRVVTGQAIRRRRNAFRLLGAPVSAMEERTRAWREIAAQTASPPAELAPIVDWFTREEHARDRFRWVLRDTLDELMDGQRTGRWAYQHLSKTEKTHLGTAVEVNLTREFDFADGAHLDWKIAGLDIDCKFSKDLGKWEIPMEMYLCDAHGDLQGKADSPALLTWLNDDTGEWAAGLVTITDDRLRWTMKDGAPARAYNRDNKRKLADAARNNIYWLWGGVQKDLPPNLLRTLSNGDRDRIFANADSGQARVNELFRTVPTTVIGRRTVLTVAQQDDAPKRARDARIQLRDEGILILGHQKSHGRIAADLHLPAPQRGEWMSIRVARVRGAESRASSEIAGERWALALEDEEGLAPAPELPRG